MITRRKSRKVMVGNMPIGYPESVSIQSMTNTDTSDVGSTLNQINQLAEAGCEIIRVAVPDDKAAASLSKIISGSPLPVVADIHFKAALAIKALEAGAAKVRINPGNIRGEEPFIKVIETTRRKGAVVRIGVNAGSLDAEVQKLGLPPAEALVESAIRFIRIMEIIDFNDYVISLKSSDVEITYQAYCLLADKTDAPFHLGVTEAGGIEQGTIKSAIGIGSLLLRGIGDTLRVSLTADPINEIKVARQILQAVGLRKFFPEIISCPTCGRTKIDLIGLHNEVQKRLAGRTKPIKIAVMGCVVNGPGEAKDADLGISGGEGFGVIFRKGKILRKLPQEELVDALMNEIDRWDKEEEERK